jgi:hypothetical protein
MTVQPMSREYLSEVRREACRLCAARYGGPFPTGPGTPCGDELPLAQLVEAVSLSPGEPSEAPAQAGYCDCPAEDLAALAAEAAEAVMRRRCLRLLEQWNDC